jgi:hypothetical protein
VPRRAFDERTLNGEFIRHELARLWRISGIPAMFPRGGNREAIHYMSAGMSPVRPRILQRGGKRDRRGRVSDSLTDKQVRRIWAAIEAAYRAGLPFTRFVTIHWEKQGVPHGQGGDATSAFLDKLRRAMTKRGLPYAAIWVREDSGWNGKGDHAHILLHVTRYRGYTRDTLRWIKTISGKPYRSGTILTHSIGRSLKASQTSPEAFLADLRGVARYVTKGAPQATAEALGLPAWGKGGRVIGQRIGMSKNLERLVSGRAVSK